MRNIAVAVLMLVVATALAAQQTKDNKPAQNAEFTWAQGAYRLDFVIKEVDEGKVLNSRSYSMIVEASDRLGPGKGVVKAGNRIPVATGTKASDTQIQYLDVGANIDARLNALEDSRLMLTSSIEISAVGATDTQGTQGLPDPAIRQIRAETFAEIFPGKANQIASMDDTVSKHRFVIEVTPTKLK